MKRLSCSLILVLLFVGACTKPHDGTQLLIKDGQLIKLDYLGDVTRQATELISGFKDEGWQIPAASQSVPERADIELSLRNVRDGVAYFFLNRKNLDGDYLLAYPVDASQGLKRTASLILLEAKKAGALK